MSKQRTTTVDGVGDVEVKNTTEGFKIMITNEKHKVVIECQDYMFKTMMHQMQIALHGKRRDKMREYNWLGAILTDTTGEKS